MASRGARNARLVSLLKRSRIGKSGGRGVIATQGTHDFLVDAGIFSRNGKSDHARLRPGAAGGVIQIAYEVVAGRCNAVVFLSEPSDDRIDSPENRALVRVCIHKNVPLILTTDDLAEWIEHYEPPGRMPEPAYAVTAAVARL